MENVICAFAGNLTPMWNVCSRFARLCYEFILSEVLIVNKNDVNFIDRATKAVISRDVYSSINLTNDRVFYALCRAYRTCMHFVTSRLHSS